MRVVVGGCFYLFIHITTRDATMSRDASRVRGRALARGGAHARARRWRARGGGAKAALRASRRDDDDDDDDDVETTSGRGVTRAVVLVPGFLSDWRAYADVAEALERSLARATGGGVVVDVARVAGADWWPTLAGGRFFCHRRRDRRVRAKVLGQGQWCEGVRRCAQRWGVVDAIISRFGAVLRESVSRREIRRRRRDPRRAARVDGEVPVRSRSGASSR